MSGCGSKAIILFIKKRSSDFVMDNMTKIRFCNLLAYVIITEDVNLLGKIEFTKEGMIDYEL